MCLNCVDFCSRHISFSISSFCFSLCLLLRVFDFVISWAINDPDFPSACSASWSASFWRTSHTSFSTFLFFFLTLPAHLQQLSSWGLVWCSLSSSFAVPGRFCIVILQRLQKLGVPWWVVPLEHPHSHWPCRRSTFVLQVILQVGCRF